MLRRRWLLLIISLLIVAAIGVLAASLHDVRFEPGRPLSRPGSSSTALVPPLPGVVAQIPLWKILLVWAAFVINLVVFFLLLPPKVRKRILRQMISFALSVLAIVLALHYKLIQLPDLSVQQPEDEPNSALGPGSANAPAGAFQPPAMSQWWLILVSFAVLAVFLVLLWLAYRWWIVGSARRFSNLDAIGAIARSSLNDIAAGQEWTDVIIQSYARMSEAVSRQRGLERHWAATPREFAERLEQSGLPAHAVERLTRLFESARYGGRSSSQSDINEAVACLNSILQACGQGE